MHYVGRFAPSPTGPLHFGSLLAAVASHCDARAARGRWLLRMEDIDPPREMPGAAGLILRQLEAYGLEWDGDVLFQHRRTDAYVAAIERLRSQGDVFWCRCSRAALERTGSQTYPGTCRAFTSPRTDAAVRLRVPGGQTTFIDRIFGTQHEDVAVRVGDFVVRRRDGLFAYQLAVVVDDAAQGVTDVVRGADLLDNTARQIVLQQRLALTTPTYAHIPVATDAHGHKLSKQTFARPLPLPASGALLAAALQFLGQSPPDGLAEESPRDILAWAAAHWRPEHIPYRQGIAAPEHAAPSAD